MVHVDDVVHVEVENRANLTDILLEIYIQQNRSDTCIALPKVRSLVCGCGCQFCYRVRRTMDWVLVQSVDIAVVLIFTSHVGLYNLQQ